MRRALASIAIVLCLQTARARADECRELTEAEVRARLREASLIVAEEEPAMRRWWATFLLAHVTMATATALIATSTPSSRDAMIVNTVSSSIAFLSLLVVTPPIVGAGGSLRPVAEDSPAARLAKLRLTEGLLQRQTNQTAFVRSWVPVTLSAAYITGASLTQLLAVGSIGGALLHAIGGSILGMGRLLLHPTSTRDRYERYLRAHGGPSCDPQASQQTAALEPSWSFVPQGIGLGFVMSF